MFRYLDGISGSTRIQLNTDFFVLLFIISLRKIWFAIFGPFTLSHLADAFIQNNLQYMCQTQFILPMVVFLIVICLQVTQHLSSLGFMGSGCQWVSAYSDMSNPPNVNACRHPDIQMRCDMLTLREISTSGDRTDTPMNGNIWPAV